MKNTDEISASELITNLRLNLPSEFLTQWGGTIDRIQNQCAKLENQSSAATESRDTLQASVDRLTGERDAALNTVLKLSKEVDLLTEKLSGIENGIEDRVMGDLLKFGIRKQSISLPKPSGEVAQAAPNLTDIAMMVKAASAGQ